MYQKTCLRHRLLEFEALPKPIVVPAIRGIVISPDGVPVNDDSIVSHTPRQWTRLNANGRLPQAAQGAPSSTAKGARFGLPQRTEPYRVLVADPAGVESVTHEDLINAQGRIQLLKWSRIVGRFTLEGEPQPDVVIRRYIDTLEWSHTRGGPRLTTEYTATTDAEGGFIFENVPPLPGRVQAISGASHSKRGVRYACRAGETTNIALGAGRAITGRMSAVELENAGRLTERAIDWSGETIVIAHNPPPTSVPARIDEAR